MGLPAITEALPQNATIGILGGGQLARMLGSAAARLGYRTLLLDPDANAPATQVCNETIVAAYDDATALAVLAKRCSVVTYEFENVPVASAEQLTAIVPLYPPASALGISQDRLNEKQHIQSLGLSVAPFAEVNTAEDLTAALKKFGKGVLKTRRFGYDGKGQTVFKTPDVKDAAAVLNNTGLGPWVLEDLIAFDFEFSIIAARSTRGEVRAYEPARNVHENGILRSCTVPAGLDTVVLEQAKTAAHALLDSLQYVGVIGIEFFALPDGQGLFINEFAPRVHNSGHWTETACATSQFEQHIRAITGLPLGTTANHAPCRMENLLGEEINTMATLLGDPTVNATSYGKVEARPGRKMGHFTRMSHDENSS
ncbi:MAG: 5-(carboxyamino)imidazole ribonucleotide synthase [Pseudomonadota bacterium]